jgi:hypothetical protein
MWRVSHSGVPIPIRGQRLRILTSQTAISRSAVSMDRVREAKRELGRVPVKRILRGKFEAWFFLKFWHRLVAQLQEAAREGGGKVNIKIQLAQNNLIQILASYVNTPLSLELFLRAHLHSELTVPSIGAGGPEEIRTWHQRILDFLFKR